MVRNTAFRVVGVAALVVLASATGVLAASVTGFFAQQNGIHQSGGGQAAHVTIRVEQALADPASDLLADPSQGCYSITPTPPSNPSPTNPVPLSFVQSTPGCPGGALDFTIQNTSDVPLRVVSVSPGCAWVSSSGVCTTGYGSDKNTDGSFVNSESPGPAGYVGSCAAKATVTPPDVVDAGGNHSNASAPPGPVQPYDTFSSRPWPIIPPHGTLAVNGTDGNNLGAGMLHLSSDTPNGCQGASFSVPLVVTAVPAP